MRRKNTNMDLVRETAISLLYMDIQETPFSPTIVSHPFTNTGITCIQTGTKIKMLNLCQSEDDLNQWRREIKQKIQECKNPYQIIMLLNRPYYLTFLKFTKTYLNSEDLTELMRYAWCRQENPNQDPNMTRSELIQIFSACDKQMLMSPEDWTYYKNLPDKLTIYRGTKTQKKNDIKALSWTLNPDIAKFFASRFLRNGEAGYIFRTTIKKEHTFAYFSDANESELVINPKYLKDIELIENVKRSKP